VLAVLAEQNRPASEACRLFEPLPQLLQNVRFAGPSPLRHPHVVAAMAAAEAELGATGRLLLRESGTERLVRVMAEGEDAALVRRLVTSLCETITGAARAV